MSVTDDLAQLVKRGYESKDVEYKGSMEWNESDKKACCELIKDVLAIANTQGGFIIVGVSEGDDSFHTDGLSKSQLATYESTRLANFVQKYAEPPINVTVRVIEVEGKSFVVIQIPRFPHEPHICVKDYPDVLSAPTIYVRTDNNESAPISRASDVRALIETAMRNRADELLTAVRAVLTGSAQAVEREQTDAERFSKQFEEALKAFAAKNSYPQEDYKGFREIYVYPAIFDEHRFDFERLQDALSRASVNYTGWPLLYIGPQFGQDTYRIEDGYETYITMKDFHDNNRLDFWQLRTSGFLYHRVLMPEEDIARRKGASSVLDISETVWHVTQTVDAIVRLYSALGIPPDERLTLHARYLGTQGRCLVSLYTTFFSRNSVCRIPEVRVNKSLTLAEWTAGLRDLAGEITASIFQMFNWNDASPGAFRKQIDELLERRL